MPPSPARLVAEVRWPRLRARSGRRVRRAISAALAAGGRARSVLDRNWRCRPGEIDIVARDAEALVVCEVKTRSATASAAPLEAVTPAQGGPAASARRSPGRAARRRACARLRFDVVSRAGCRAESAPVGQHLPGWPDDGTGIDLLGVARRGRRALVVRSRPTSARGCPGWALHRAARHVRRRVARPGRAAVINSGQQLADLRITVGLSPARCPKAGTPFRPAASRSRCSPRRASFPLRRRARPWHSASSVSTAGCVRCRGCFPPSVSAARQTGSSAVVVPRSNAARGAARSTGVEVARRQLARRVRARCCGVSAGRRRLDSGLVDPQTSTRPAADDDGRPGRRSRSARGAPGVEVAAAGRHHLFLEGPPGAGKTMLAERLPGCFPTSTVWQSLEVTPVHSLAGRLSRDDPRVITAAVQAPHHADTRALRDRWRERRLVKPGAISLAHHGVLFLDEAPEFRPSGARRAAAAARERGDLDSAGRRRGALPGPLPARSWPPTRAPAGWASARGGSAAAPRRSGGSTGSG